MKFECVREKIVDVLVKASRVTSKNLTLPILQCVLLVAKENTLTVKSTNLDLGFEFVLPVKVIKEGVIAVPAGILTSYISGISQERNITCESDENTLKIVTSKGSTSIKLFPYNDFPLIPIVGKEHTLSINSQDLVTGLKSVTWAASTTSIKPELSSVYIYPAKSGICFVATDSFRLAEKVLPLKSPNFPPILVPHKNIQEIIHIFDGVHTAVELHIAKNQVAFIAEHLYLMSRVVDGSFPDYQKIIPQSGTTEVTILRQDLLQTLRLANIFMDKWSQVEFLVEPKKKKLEIRSRNTDVGELKENLNGSLSGEEVTVRFSYKYVIDCLSTIATDSITLYFNGADRALMIRGVGDASFTYIVMPMNR